MLSLFGVVIAVIVIAVTYDYVLSHGGITNSALNSALDVTVSRFSELAGGQDVARGTGESAIERVTQGLAYASGIVPNYIGWSVCLLVLIALLYALRGEQRAEIGFLLFPAVGFALGPMLASRPVDASRYFVPNALPLTVLAAFGLAFLLRHIRDRQSRFWISAGAVLVIITPALWFDMVLMTTNIFY